MRRSRKPSDKAQPKKPKVSRAQLTEIKQALGDRLDEVYTQVMRFCSGRPPRKAVSGSYQEALAYKDLVSKTRGLVLNKNGSPGQLEARINRFKEKLEKFKQFE